MNTFSRPAVLVLLLGFSATENLLSSEAAYGDATGSTPSEVYVLGTLYKRHESVPIYSLEVLSKIVERIKPDVLVLDCTPSEVRAQRVSASKVEYSKVIFPLMRDNRYRVYAAEPDEPLFSEIVQSTRAAITSFESARPEVAAALKMHVNGVYDLLAWRWQSPADSQDDVTAAVLTAKVALEGDLVGEAMTHGWNQWNQHWTDTILRAVAENPGMRVLAVTGIENRAFIMQRLRQDSRVKVIDMPRWLREHAQSVVL